MRKTAIIEPPFKLILLLCILAVVGCLKTHVTCKRENTDKLFQTLYNIRLLVNDTEVAMVDHHSANKTSKGPLPFSIFNISGNLEENILEADLELDCDMTETVECQLYGFSNDIKDSKTVVLSPIITFEAVVKNKNYRKHPELENYETGGSITIQCSADVGSVDERWSVNVMGKPLDSSDFSINSNPTRSACAYHTTASLIYTFKTAGWVNFICKYGHIEVEHFSLEVVDMHEILSFHMLLSSMLLVYLPFVAMPALWYFCRDRFKAYKKSGCITNVVSVSAFFIFIIWWICVNRQYAHSKAVTGYITFAVSESLFMIFYLIYRFIFLCHREEGSWYGELRGYNSRVTTSYGALIVPVISWLMIRCPNSLPKYPIEIVFWIFSMLCTLLFVFVSHRREHDDWVKKSE